MKSFHDADRAVAATLMAEAEARYPIPTIVCHIRAQYPGVDDRSIAKAAFWSVTRPAIDAELIPRLYDLALKLRH